MKNQKEKYCVFVNNWVDISIIHSTAHLQCKTFKSLPFGCFLSKQCSIWDWFLNKYFGRSSVFQWNMLLFKGRSFFFFWIDCHWTLINIRYYHSKNWCWRVKSMAKELIEWTIHLFLINTCILSSRICENQISSGILTIFKNWGLNYYVLDKLKFSKLISVVIWVVQLWRIPTLITKLTLCSCITKLFAFCPLCVWDMDESLSRLKHALSRPSSVYTKS